MNNRIKVSFFSKISTKPSEDAMIWQGKRSMLATVILEVIYFCRCLSFLQYIKHFFRFIVKKRQRATIDKNATRINVPPMLPEIYFICWFILILIIYRLGINHRVINILIVYYIFESFVWIIYYSVFRRFFEENYSIYHVLEYFVNVLIVFPTQALGFSVLCKQPFWKTITGILGNGGDSIPDYLNLIGVLYGAIVIGMLIQKFPEEKVKVAEKSVVSLIIGNGDVVINRLYPALLKNKYTQNLIKRFDMCSSQMKETEGIFYCDNKCELLKKIDEYVNDNSIVWIACPSPFHVSYLDYYIPSDVGLIVCEKPISVNMDEILKVEKLIANPNARKKIFFLSYYMLEKALPLMYLVSRNKVYEQYLDIKAGCELYAYNFLLGELKKIDVTIIEGIDDREWIKSSQNGGQLIETFIHNVLVASLACGLPTRWSELKWKMESSVIKLEARCNETKIYLHQEKNNMDEKKRYALMEYTNGSIYANLEEQSLLVTVKDEKAIQINVKEQYTDKYAIQVDLVNRVFFGDLDSKETDGLMNQIEVIKWLLSQKEFIV